MIPLIWSSAFARSARRLLRQNPLLRQPFESTLRRLADDPFHPALHTHKLKGNLAGVWACTLDFDNRILFEFVDDDAIGDRAIFLLAIGSHDEVY